MADAPSAHIDLTLRTEQFRTQISSIKQALRGLRSQLQKTARIARNMLIVGVGAIGGLLALAGKQVQAEAKLEAILRATGNAAGFSADELKKYAAELQKLTTFGDEATIEMMAILATFKQIRGPAFKDAVVAIQDIATVLGQDLRTAALQVGKALNEPSVGLRYLRQSGISFTQQQIELIKVLEKEGRLFEAQGIILREIAAQFGGAAQAAAKTFWGRMIQLKNAVSDAGETIGSIFVPEINKLIERIGEIVPDVVDWVTANKDLIISTAKWAAGIGAAIIALSGLVAGLNAAYAAAVAIGSAPVLVAIGLLVAVLTDAQLAAIKLNAALRASEAESQRAADAFKALAGARQLLGRETDPSRRLDALRKQKAALQELKEIEEGRARAAGARLDEELQEKQLYVRDHFEWMGKTVKDHNRIIEQNNAEVIRATNAADRWGEELKKVERALRKATESMGDHGEIISVADTKIENFMSSLEKERALLTAAGLDARMLSAGIEKLTEDQRAYAESILDEIDAHERARKAEERRYDIRKKASEQAIRALDEQIDLLNKIGLITGEVSQAEVWAEELQRMGHTRDQIEKIVALRHELADLEQAESQRKAQESAAASVVGTRTSLVGLYRAISGAAAKAGAQQQMAAAERTAVASERMEQKTGRVADLAKQSKDVLSNILGVITEVKADLPLVGAYGR